MTRQVPTLARLARAGFDELDRAAAGIAALTAATGLASESMLEAFSVAADPDEALIAVQRLHDRAPAEVAAVLAHHASAERMSRLLGASRGMGDFLLRHPSEIAIFQEVPAPPLGVDEARVRAPGVAR